MENLIVRPRRIGQVGHHSDMHTWTAAITGYANMVLDPVSEYYVGPWSPGEIVQIASLRIKNDGNMTDRPHILAVEYPGEPEENPLYDAVYPFDIDPGRLGTVNIIDITAPSEPGDWPLGVKVWGSTTETEPPWRLAGTAIFGAPIRSTTLTRDYLSKITNGLIRR